MTSVGDARAAVRARGALRSDASGTARGGVTFESNHACPRSAAERRDDERLALRGVSRATARGGAASEGDVTPATLFLEDPEVTA